MFLCKWKFLHEKKVKETSQLIVSNFLLSLCFSVFHGKPESGLKLNNQRERKCYVSEPRSKRKLFLLHKHLEENPSTRHYFYGVRLTERIASKSIHFHCLCLPHFNQRRATMFHLHCDKHKISYLFLPFFFCEPIGILQK